MDQIKVSVIIPVYNGETYLRQCLDSVRAQTLEDIEIICVDDGSTDFSWQILEKYRETDARFRLVRRQDNQGLSVTRNDGLAIAQGEYIIFWDCDDFFEPKALELLYQKAQQTNADICVCGADRYLQDKGKCYPMLFYLNAKLVPRDSETFNRLTNPKHILNFTTNAVWNKLLRRTFLERHHLVMPPYRFGEDVYFTITALCLAERIAIIKNVLVHYRYNNPTSLVGQSGVDTLRHLSPRIAVSDHLRSLEILPEDSFGWSSISGVVYALRLSETREAFLKTASFLHKDGILEKLCITEREPEYYKDSRQEQYAKHLIHDDPEELLAFLMHDTYLEIREVTASRNELRASRDKLKKQLAKDKTAYESALSQLSEEKQQCEKKNKSLSKKNTQLQQEQKTLAEENKQLHAKVEGLTAQIEQQQAEFQMLIERNQHLIAKTETLSRQLEKVKTKLSSANKALQDLINSRTFRLGKAILYLPRKILAPFRQK